ncbi:hypothetical protein ACJMK2_024531 [Sinanodonta woodiana]|uniref:Inositol 2-dehydrogenase n=1 Tax=Sinanodonta woodiana TaxID=1069815 RepID=A0ABD3XE45_SINWO
MASKIGFAIFGMGSMGIEHVKNIVMSPRASLRWIIRKKLKDAQQFTKEFDLSTRCGTTDMIDQVMNDSSVQAVIICSPTDTHEPLLRKSLEAGKSVFCEKPITTEIVTTAACYDLAKKKRKPLFCAFQRRFDPSFQQVHDKIKSGELGRLRVLKSTSRDVKPPPVSYVKSSGGIFFDSTIHDLDVVSWMVGSKPRTVYAQGNAFNPEIGNCGDNDQVFVVIKHENGVLSFIDNGRLAPYGYDQRVEVLCEKGMLTVENRPLYNMTSHTAMGNTVPQIHQIYKSRYIEAYRNELEHFLDVIQEKDELKVTKEDTIKAMQLANLCTESVKARKELIYMD